MYLGHNIFLWLATKRKFLSYRSWQNCFQPIKSHIIIISCFFVNGHNGRKRLYRQMIISNDHLRQEVTQIIDRCV